MRTLKLALLASVAVAGVSTAASAADLIVDAAPAPAPVVDNYSAVDWNGPYAGLFLLAGVEGSVQWLNNDT